MKKNLYTAMLFSGGRMMDSLTDIEGRNLLEVRDHLTHHWRDQLLGGCVVRYGRNESTTFHVIDWREDVRSWT